MGLIKGLVKGAAISLAAAVCPPAAGVLVLGNVAHKVGKAITDDDNANTGKHIVSVFGSFAGDVIDVDNGSN